jgi:DNA invertase Pin-like site-specific DNA recombinase
MNCLIYARVSTDKQAQKDLSIPAQIKAKTPLYDSVNLEYSAEYYPPEKS